MWYTFLYILYTSVVYILCNFFIQNVYMVSMWGVSMYLQSLERLPDLWASIPNLFRYTKSFIFIQKPFSTMIHLLKQYLLEKILPACGDYITTTPQRKWRSRRIYECIFWGSYTKFALTYQRENNWTCS